MISWRFPHSTCIMGTLKFKDSPPHCHTKHVWSFSCHAASSQAGASQTDFFESVFSSASTTGFKLKFQQVIGHYQAKLKLPKGPTRSLKVSMWLFRKLLETLASKGASRTEGLNPARTATAPKMIKVFLEAQPFLSHSSPRKQAGSTHRNSVLRQGLTGHVSLWIHQGLMKMIRSLLMAGCCRWKGLSYSRFLSFNPWWLVRTAAISRISEDLPLKSNQKQSE